MNRLVEEWIYKAKGDYHSAFREYRARNNPNYDSARFHAQQCAEKYLMAILQKNDERFGRILDLLTLLNSCIIIIYEPELELQRELIAYLNPFSVAFRYPGESATRDQAKRAIKTIKQLKPVFDKIPELGVED